MAMEKSAGPLSETFGRKGRKVKIVDGRDFASDAVMVHGIDAVGGDLRLPGLVGALAKVAFNGDAADGESFGNLAVAGRGRDKIANPIRGNFHYANCSRKLISP